jgi:hypothetical protein
MNDDEIKAIEARWAATTAVRWWSDSQRYGPPGSLEERITYGMQPFLLGNDGSIRGRAADFEAYDHCCGDIAALLAEVKRLRTIAGLLRTAIDIEGSSLAYLLGTEAMSRLEAALAKQPLDGKADTDAKET